MTDRYSAFLVVLDENIRDDDAESTLTALRQVRGVASVVPHISDIGEQIAQARADIEWQNDLVDFIRTRRAR